jgi:hypothetical protein
MEANPMTPITIQRFVKELEKLKLEVDAGTLGPDDYDGRLARIIGELRERGLEGDRAAVGAALADATKRGVITATTGTHIQSKLGLA